MSPVSRLMVYGLLTEDEYPAEVAGGIDLLLAARTGWLTWGKSSQTSR
jgi:hypothetical protein